MLDDLKNELQEEMQSGDPREAKRADRLMQIVNAVQSLLPVSNPKMIEVSTGDTVKVDPPLIK